MATMKMGLKKTNMSDTPNTQVAVRCPMCQYKRWVINGVDPGCPGLCVEEAPKVAAKATPKAAPKAVLEPKE